MSSNKDSVREQIEFLHKIADKFEADVVMNVVKSALTKEKIQYRERPSIFDIVVGEIDIFYDKDKKKLIYCFQNLSIEQELYPYGDLLGEETVLDTLAKMRIVEAALSKKEE